MEFLITLILTGVAVILLRNGISRYPVALYAVAVMCDIIFFIAGMVSWLHPLSLVLTILMRRGGLSVALFVIVMYIGVLPRSGRLSKWLRPIRAELSIAACLLIMGHVLSYLTLYIPGSLVGSIPRGSMVLAFVIAACLLVLMIPLCLTSLRWVKRHMSTGWWNRIQKLAYVFYALIYAHLMCMVAPSAFNGGLSASVNILVYTVLFVTYAILRIWRAITESTLFYKKDGSIPVSEAEGQAKIEETIRRA